jgi:hypothetical protein
MFKSLSREHHEQAKGELLMTVEMEPGDLLYLPRGQYHDALADDGGAVHIAFGVTYPIGMDVMSLLFEQVITEPAFRANLPRAGEPGSEQRLGERLAVLGGRLSAALADPKTAKRIAALPASFTYPRGSYDLPELLNAAPDAVAASPEPSFKVKGEGIRLVEQGGRFGLVREGSRNAVEVPAGVSHLVDWVLKRQRFSKRELIDAFPEQQSTVIDKLIKDLANMRLTEVI